MRTMLRVTIDHEAGSRAIKDGTLPKLMQATFDDLKPEAAYFGSAQNGHRTAMFVFDLRDSSQLPMIAERFFEMKCNVEFFPVMNREDLMAGLGALARGR